MVPSHILGEHHLLSGSTWDFSLPPSQSSRLHNPRSSQVTFSQIQKSFSLSSSCTATPLFPEVGWNQKVLQKGFRGHRSGASPFHTYSPPAPYPGACCQPSLLRWALLDHLPCSAPIAGLRRPVPPGHGHTWALHREESPLPRPVRASAVVCTRWFCSLKLSADFHS